MKSKVSKGGGKKVLPPEGPTPAICYQVIYLGHQESTWQGETSWKPKFRFTFELPEHTHVFTEEKGEQPLAVSVEHNDSLNPKSNMYKFLSSWFPNKDLKEGAEVDYSKLAGKKALISIKYVEGKGNNAGNKYANIGTIMPLPKGMPCADKAANPVIVFDCDNPDDDILQSLPEFLQNKILASKEMKEAHGDVHAAASASEEVFDAPDSDEEEEDVF